MLAIALFGLVALVILPEGRPSTGERLAALAAIGGLLAAAWAIAAWAPRWARGSAMLLAGFAGITVFGAVVVERLRDGIAVGDVLGALAGVGGIVLVVSGWRGLLAGVTRAWLRAAIAVIATLVFAQFVVLPAGVALRATNRARPISSGRTPQALGLSYEDVRITSSDGTRLAAWWIPSRNGAAVIALPGASSTRENVLDHAALLAGDGYGVASSRLPGPRRERGPGDAVRLGRRARCVRRRLVRPGSP
jgi:hypothetical protein